MARLSRAYRAKTLELGYWQRHDGSLIALRDMADPHLVNALLRTLIDDGESSDLTRPLAVEIERRHLRAYAERMVAERTQGRQR